MISAVAIMLSWAILAVAAVVFLLSVIFLGEVLASFLPARRVGLPEGVACRMTVIMPAHDEAAVIDETIHRVLRHMPPGGRLLVVADNCTDDTATRARACGADVICRDDPNRRGKGYALDFAVQFLAASPPDVVLIMDADCVPETNALEILAARCLASNRPVQAWYDLQPPAGGLTPYLTIATFAWRVKNYVRPLGLARLGLPCQLMGTGMAFPWTALATAQLSTGHLVEDMVLGQELAAAGWLPLFEPAARVTSAFPTSVEGQTTQRARWETGHLGVVMGLVPRQIRRGLTTRNASLLWMALDAAVPPLSSLVLSIMATVVASGVIAMASGHTGSLAVACASATALTVAVLAAWWTVGRDLPLLKTLPDLPRYVFCKLGIYAGALRGRQIEWIRSKRD